MIKLNAMFILKRVYLKEATHGELLFNNEHIAYTIELPWLENQKQISCIPEGEYNLRRRYSKNLELSLSNMATCCLVLLIKA